jgi:DNA polymerase III subunit delta
LDIHYVSGKPDRLFPAGFKPVYVLYGDEDSLKAEAERDLVRKFVEEDFAEFDLEVLNADVTDASAILGAATQIPFGSERRVVVVRGMEQWRDRGRVSECEQLAARISTLGDTACLILIIGAEEEEARRKTIFSPKVDTLLKAGANLVACRGLKDELLSQWIRDRFQAEGKKVGDDAINALIAAAGTEMRVLALEIGKLVHYTGDRLPVTSADVREVVASQAEDVMFQCVDAICRRNTDRALTLLNELHRFDPRPQAVAGKLLSLLTRQFRMLWQARYLASEGVSPRDLRSLPAAILDELPTETSIMQVSFKAADVFAMAQRYSFTTLQKTFDLLLQCDLANKGGVLEDGCLFGADPVINLQLLVLQIAAG